MSPLTECRKHLGKTQDEFAGMLGISRQYLSKLENSTGPLSSKLNRRLAEIRQDMGARGDTSTGRMIQVLSWAQAGHGIDYEELPFDWQKQIATDCPDERAFAVEIQGDSMEPKFSPGDIAILMPSHPPRNNSLVVARLATEGVVFKVFTARGISPEKICTFTSYNPVFRPMDVPEQSVLWSYPVYQTVRQVWR